MLLEFTPEFLLFIDCYLTRYLKLMFISMIFTILEVWKLIGGDGSKVESLAIPRAEKDTIKEYDHHIIRLVTHHKGCLVFQL